MKDKRPVEKCSWGLLASVDVTGGEVKLVLQDVDLSHETPGPWRTSRLYTEKLYPKRSFAALTLRAEDYQEIGFNVVNRLRALCGLESQLESTPRRRRKKRA